MRGNVFQDEQGNYITESELRKQFIKELNQENRELLDENAKLSELWANCKEELRIFKKIEKEHQKLNGKLRKEIKNMKEDINFCLKSIKQEMEMSKDSRTRQEMKTCYEILGRYENE